MNYKEYLEAGTPYAEGLELLKKYDAKNAMLKVVQGKETKWNREKIVYLLSKINKVTPLPEDDGVAMSGGTAEVLSAKKKQHDRFETDNDTVVELSNTRDVLFAEQTNLRGGLEAMETDEDRRIAALRIVEIDDLLAPIYEKLDYFKEHGKLPEVEGEKKVTALADMSEGDLIKKRNNNRAYISNPKNKENKQGEVKRRTEENVEIEKLLLKFSK